MKCPSSRQFPKRTVKGLIVKGPFHFSACWVTPKIVQLLKTILKSHFFNTTLLHIRHFVFFLYICLLVLCYLLIYTYVLFRMYCVKLFRDFLSNLRTDVCKKHMERVNEKRFVSG